MGYMDTIKRTQSLC